MERFESYLLDHAPRFETLHPHYEVAFWEMVRAGGKRFRPQLLLGVVEACTPLLLPGALPVALALETTHTYSLIHDDLPAMDDASWRRSHPTLHTTYGETTAILMGDALNTYSFELIARAPLAASVRIALVEELARASGKMVLGQAMDCHFEREALTLEQLERVHEAKTGALISASLQMGALISGLKRSERDHLTTLGREMGLLFQIEDDLIDALLTREEAGKDTRNDQQKNSYVTLLGVEGAQRESERRKEAIIRSLEALQPQLSLSLSSLLSPWLKPEETHTP